MPDPKHIVGLTSYGENPSDMGNINSQCQTTLIYNMWTFIYLGKKSEKAGCRIDSKLGACMVDVIIFKQGKMYLFFQLSIAAIIEIKFKALAKMFDH